MDFWDAPFAGKGHSGRDEDQYSARAAAILKRVEKSPTQRGRESLE